MVAAAVGEALIVLSDLQSGEKRFFVEIHDVVKRSYELYLLVVGLRVNEAGFLGLRKIL